MVQGMRSFTHSALGVFLISLLLSDLIQGAAFSINFKWAADGNMHPSVACTAQGESRFFSSIRSSAELRGLGSVSQVGDLGSAIWYAESENELEWRRLTWRMDLGHLRLRITHLGEWPISGRENIAPNPYHPNGLMFQSTIPL